MGFLLWLEGWFRILLAHQFFNGNDYLIEKKGETGGRRDESVPERVQMV
jgi:hypothetical protein